MPQTLRVKPQLPRATPPAKKIPSIRLTHATPSTLASPHPDETLLSPSAVNVSADTLSPGTPKRVTLKKSKLGLKLTGSRRDRDFSDITRRVGISSSQSGGEIYVDPNHDPDIGEIVVVKKKKSRAKLDGIRWALGDKTNTNGYTSSKEEKKKGKEKKEKEKKEIKKDESSKWWTIGRGRKDSKEKEPSKMRSKCKFAVILSI